MSDKKQLPTIDMEKLESLRDAGLKQFNEGKCLDSLHSPEIKEEGKTPETNAAEMRLAHMAQSNKYIGMVASCDMELMELQRDEARRNVESLVCQKEDILVERDQARRERDELEEELAHWRESFSDNDAGLEDL